VCTHIQTRRFPGFKRYSGEGADSLYPALQTLIQGAAAGGTTDVVIGMPHRGRLAFLVTQLQYPLRNLFAKMQGRRCVSVTSSSLQSNLLLTVATVASILCISRSARATCRSMHLNVHCTAQHVVKRLQQQCAHCSHSTLL
jgi:hypothetical protein